MNEWTAQDIKDLRKQLGLNQVELAAKFGLTKQTISNWENMRARPHPIFRRKLSRLARKKNK